MGKPYSFYMPEGLKMYFESGLAKALSEEDNQEIIGILNRPLTEEQRIGNHIILKERIPAEVVVI